MPKISALTSLAQADVVTTTDVLPIVDATAPATTKKVTVQAMVNAGLATLTTLPSGIVNASLNSITPTGGTLEIAGQLGVSNTTGRINVISTTGVNSTFANFVNTGGSYYVGVENSTGSSFGAAPYALLSYVPSGRVIQQIVAGTGVITEASAAGLSVTGSISAASYLTVGSGMTVGSGTGNRYATVNGGASGTNGGATLVVQNAGNSVAGLGNKSALLGGAYDATPMLYGNAPIEVNQALNVTGSISATSYVEGAEQAAPAAPAANGYRIFAQDNGAGKTQLMVIFATGAAQQIAIEP